MDKTLNERMAEAMGWVWTYDPDMEAYYWYKDGQLAMTPREWNPSEDVNQAIMVLEKVAAKKEWTITRTGDEEFGPYECCISVPDECEFIGMRAEHLAYCVTPALAICSCVIKACEVP